MSNQHYMVMGFSLLLLIFLFWKEIKRTNKSRLALRLVASLLAVASLACMALPISIMKKINQVESREAILLTEEYNKDSLENFIRKGRENIRVYNKDSVAWIDTGITTLHVFGYGLSSHELKVMNDIPLVFHPSFIDNGITAVHWNQQLITGEKLSVQGTFVNTNLSPVKIVLDGLNTALDSVIIPPQKTSTFELNAVPKNIGKAVYSLIISSKKEIVATEPVPVEIKVADTLKILLLAASPDFENKFLRNWLSENAYVTATRTRISKSKYDKTFINTTSFSFNKITSSLLDKFDIVISDATELAALSGAEQAAIRSAVQDDGMGLIVRADSISSPGVYYAIPFPQFLSTIKQPPPAGLYIQDAVKATAPLIAGEHSYIRYKPGTQPLVLDSSSNILISSSMEGSGKIVFTVISNTYTWMLAGNSKDYYSFWSCLLQKAAKRNEPEQSLLIGEALPIVNEPVGLRIEIADNSFLHPNIDNNHLSLNQNPDLPFQWEGIYWPTEPGWQPAITIAGQRHEWYVYDKWDWKNIAAIEKIKQTLQFINDQNNTAKKTVQPQKYVRTDLPGFYFFLIFIVCCSFLWIEKKLSVS